MPLQPLLQQAARFLAQDQSNPIAVADQAGLLVWANDPFLNNTGYTLSELVGTKPGALMQCAETDPNEIARIGRGMRERVAVSARLRNRRKSGALYWNDLCISPLFAQGGEHLGFISVQKSHADERPLRSVTQALQSPRVAWSLRSDKLHWSGDHVQLFAPLRPPASMAEWITQLPAAERNPIGESAASFRRQPRASFSHELSLADGRTVLVHLPVLREGANAVAEGFVVPVRGPALEEVRAERDLLLREMLQMEQIGGFIWSRSGDVLSEISDTALGLLGFDSRARPSLHILLKSVLQPDRTMLLRGLRESLERSRSFSQTVRCHSNFTQLRLLRISAKPTATRDGLPALVGVVVEATPGWSLRERLHEREQAFHSIMSVWPDTVVLFNAQSRVRQAYVPDERRSGIRIGMHATDLLGTELAQQLIGDLFAPVRASRVIDMSFEEPGPQYLEVRALRLQQGEWLLVMRDVTARRAAERHAAQKLAEYQTLAESLPDAILRTDREGRNIFCNRAAEEIFGVSRHAVRGARLSGFPVPAEVAARAAAAIKHVVEQAMPETFEFEFPAPGRGSVTMESRIFPELSADGAVIGALAIVRNISDARAHAVELSEENQFYAEIQGFVRNALSSRARRVILKEAVDTACRLFVASTCHILLLDADGLRIAEPQPVDPVALSRNMAPMAWQVIDTQQTLMVEDYADWRRSLKNDDPTVPDRNIQIMQLPISFDGHCMGTLLLARALGATTFSKAQQQRAEVFVRMVSVALDNAILYQSAIANLNEKIRTQSALDSEKALLSVIADHLPNVFFFRLLRTANRYRCLFITSGLEQVLGLSVEAVMDDFELLTRRIHPDDRSALDPSHAGERLDLEVRADDMQGKQKWLRMFQTERALEADASLMEGFFLDVTQEKENAIKLEQLIKQLRVRNQDLEQFNYAASHDIRNALVSISGMSGLIKLDLGRKQYDNAARRLERIVRSSERMARMLDELLRMSKLGHAAVELKPIALRQPLQVACELLSAKIEASGAKITCGFASDASLIGDASLLRDAFTNLIGNAIKFVSPGAQPQIHIGLEHSADGGTATVSVRDQGLGIEKDYCERIFGLFERIETDIEGTGVGLTLVRRVAELHNGRAFAQSDGLNMGACFYLEIPQA